MPPRMAAHAALLAADGALLAAPADPVDPDRRRAGVSGSGARPGARVSPSSTCSAIRRGETMNEVLVRPGEELDGEPYQGIAPIRAEIPTAGAGLGRRAPARGG